VFSGRIQVAYEQIAECSTLGYRMGDDGKEWTRIDFSSLTRALMPHNRESQLLWVTDEI